ncbi:MAG: RNA polymerase sporulation sigma factor SigK [Clostridia bacterium]|nr:RNA polymerase sporulation sigma factor SigK [Clostridia bacterium]
MLEKLFSGFLFFVLHLNVSGSFPPPLSAAQEAECLRAMAQGDAKARDMLIEHNLRLVAHIIKKYYASCDDQDDLISIGTIGLIKAVNTFDPKKGARLATYAARCIENEILMFFRAQKKSAQDVSIQDPIDVDGEGNPLTLMDILSCEDTIADDLDIRVRSEKLHELLRDMPESREKTILILRYGLYGNEAHTQRMAAAKLGISRSYVSRLEKKALTSLRRKLR